jgi:hypothetical protein
MAVGSGRYRQPAGYSEQLRGIIDATLVVDPEARPDIGMASLVIYHTNVYR